MTEAVPEVTFGGAILLEANDEDAWQKALLEIATSEIQGIPPIQLPTWDTVTSEVVWHILDLAWASAA